MALAAASSVSATTCPGCSSCPKDTVLSFEGGGTDNGAKLTCVKNVFTAAFNVSATDLLAAAIAEGPTGTSLQHSAVGQLATLQVFIPLTYGLLNKTYAALNNGAKLTPCAGYTQTGSKIVASTTILEVLFGIETYCSGWSSLASTTAALSGLPDGITLLSEIMKVSGVIAQYESLAQLVTLLAPCIPTECSQLALAICKTQTGTYPAGAADYEQTSVFVRGSVVLAEASWLAAANLTTMLASTGLDKSLVAGAGLTSPVQIPCQALISQLYSHSGSTAVTAGALSFFTAAAVGLSM